MFCATTFISFFFQFIGFLVTYLLHTTHAAKYGSRAGLGLTLIQYGFYSRNRYTDPQADEQGTHGTWVSDALGPGGTPTETSHPIPVETVSTHTRDWLSILFMTLGNTIIYLDDITFDADLKSRMVPPSHVDTRVLEGEEIREFYSTASES